MAGTFYYEDDIEDYDDEEEDDEDDEEDDEENEDGFGEEDPTGYGEDPNPEQEEDPLKDDEEESEDGEGGEKEGKEKKGKKDKKKGKGKKGKEGEEGEVKGKVKGGKKKPNTVEMNSEASNLKAFIVAHRKCPFCHQKSIFTEPIGSALTRKTTQYILSVISRGMINAERKQRYVCLNKHCKAYFTKTGTRFVDSITLDGKIVPSHGLPTPVNPFGLKS